MSDIKVTPTAEADPAATSIQNDKTVEQTSNPDQTTELSAAPTTSEDAVKAEAKTEEQNEKKEEKAEDASKPTENQGEKRGGRPQNGGRNKRVRSNYDELPESSDPEEIRRQVEFYFSDSNLPTDNYLLKQTGGHKNDPVDLKVIHNFKRMRHFQPYSAVLEACKASTLINVTDDGQITRKEPLSEKFSDNVDENRKMLEDETMARSIYAKGFGEEKTSTQTDIEEFFSVYGTFNAVRLRRHQQTGDFKGSVFVEFSDEKTAEDFLKLDPKPAFQGQELSIKSKKEYVDEKLEGIKNGTIKPNEHWKDRRDNDQRGSRGGRGGRGRGRGGRGRGGRGGRGGDRGDREDRKRGREDEGQQGESKKAKTEE